MKKRILNKLFKNEIEMIKKDAEYVGYEKGYTDGYEEGYNKGRINFADELINTMLENKN